MQTSKFEEIRMKDDETFDNFYAKLNDLANSSLNLGEKIYDAKIVKKIMRSLLKWFRPKVTAIEENLDTMKVEEQTYELSLPQLKKVKSIALKTVKEETDDSFDEESLNDEDLTLLVRRFIKFLKPRKWYSKNRPSRFIKKSKDEFIRATQQKKEQAKKAKNFQSI